MLVVVRNKTPPGRRTLVNSLRHFRHSATCSSNSIATQMSMDSSAQGRQTADPTPKSMACPAANGALMRQLQERLVDVQAMYTMAQLSPGHALGSCATANVNHFILAIRAIAPVQNSQDRVADGSRTLQIQGALTLLCIVGKELCVAGTVPRRHPGLCALPQIHWLSLALLSAR